MTIMSKLKLSEKTRSSMLVAPETQARAKVLDALEHQLKAAEAELTGTLYTIPRMRYVDNAASGEREKREIQEAVKPWWFKDMAGDYYLQLKYGTKKIEIAPGKYSIEVGKVENLVGTIKTVMEAGRSGELDTPLMNARGGKRVRKVLQLRG
jgi:hypothetical protein